MQFTQSPLSANASLLGNSLGAIDGYNDRNASKDTTEAFFVLTMCYVASPSRTRISQLGNRLQNLQVGLESDKIVRNSAVFNA